MKGVVPPRPSASREGRTLRPVCSPHNGLKANRTNSNPRSSSHSPSSSLRPVYIPTGDKFKTRSSESTPCPGPSPCGSLSNFSGDENILPSDTILKAMLQPPVIHIDNNFTPTVCEDVGDRGFSYCQVLGPSACARCRERNGRQEVTERLDKQFPHLASLPVSRMPSRRNSLNPSYGSMKVPPESDNSSLRLSLPAIEAAFRKSESKPRRNSHDTNSPRTVRISFPPI